MKTTISYGRTLSDKDYGSFRVDISQELEEGDNAQAIINAMKTFAIANLNEQILEIKDPKQAELPIKEKPAKKVAKEIEEVEEEEEVEEKPKKATKTAKKAAKKVVKKKAAIPYDRNLPVHKDMFLALTKDLGIRHGNMTPDEKLSLKATSLFMEGHDMLEAGSTDIIEMFSHNTKSVFGKELEKRKTDV